MYLVLILKRNCSEKVIIKCPDGKVINIYLTEIVSNSSAKIGFEAPQNYIILREEVVDRTDKEGNR